MSKPFALSTGDPRFDKDAPVTVNGYLFVPANYDMAGRVPAPKLPRTTVVQVKRRKLVEVARG